MLTLKNYLLGEHMTPFDQTASGMEVIAGSLLFFLSFLFCYMQKSAIVQGTSGAQMFTEPQQQQAAAEGVGTFAGDAALWAAADLGPDDPGHQMFGGSDPLIYLRYVPGQCKHESMHALMHDTGTGSFC